MPYNTLLLPLLGGYILITHWNYTRFQTARHSGQRLLFHSAIAGVVLLVLSYLVVQFLIFFCPEFHGSWRRIMPFPYTGTSFGALFLGCVFPIGLNRMYPRKKAQRKVLDEWGNYLELVLEEALQKTTQVEITMRNGKVYTGFVLNNFNPAYERKSIQILPVSSGYRDPTTHMLVFTTHYALVYLEMIEDESSEESFLDPKVVIPISEIASLKPFDPVVFDRFNELEGERRF